MKIKINRGWKNVYYDRLFNLFIRYNGFIGNFYLLRNRLVQTKRIRILCWLCILCDIIRSNDLSGYILCVLRG